MVAPAMQFFRQRELEMRDGRFLQRFPALRSNDPEVILKWFASNYSVSEITMSDHADQSETIVNSRELNGMVLTYAQYGAPISARLRDNSYFVQGFPVSGRGQAYWNHNTVSVGEEAGGIVGGPRSEALFSYESGFSHLIVKISPAALTRKLSVMIGRPVDPPLRLYSGPDNNPAYLAGQTRLVRFLAEEVNRTDGALPPAAIASIEDAFVMTYLIASNHNYSHLLNGDAPTVAPWQVRSAIDYIEQNWDKPITVATLCRITGTSSRSLFHLFKRTYGVSPMVFVRKIRLRRAKTMLSDPAMERSVTAIGVQCGFSNLGYFARCYFEAFGEKPSDTLKAHHKGMSKSTDRTGGDVPR